MTARRALLQDNVQSRKETPCRRTRCSANMMELLAMFGPQNSLRCPKVDVTMCLLVETEKIPPQGCIPPINSQVMFALTQ